MYIGLSSCAVDYVMFLNVAVGDIEASLLGQFCHSFISIIL